jgi:gamma-glutamylcyclotransferase (GGCT)/AIG2-like uncharacterized protein YtfP
MPGHLFVYGTLHPDKAPPEIRDDARKLRLVGRGTVRGKLLDLGEYPGALLGPRYNGTIPGHVFLLPDDAGLLARLDRYEGFLPNAPERSLFLRRLVEAELEDGSFVECWMYEWNQHGR